LKLLLKILFSIFALLVVFLLVIFFTPINSIVKAPLQSYGISYENAKGNIFSGNFRNVKLANLSISNINYENSYSHVGLKTNITDGFYFTSIIITSFDLRKITVSNTKYSRDFKLSFIPVINIETELEELILEDFKCMGINGDAYIKSVIFKESLIGELSCTDDSYKIILFDRKYNQLGLITTDFNNIYLNIKDSALNENLSILKINGDINLKIPVKDLLE
tara:strand:+ start:1754 stop:2416 length:663 start_codon:yes stop_codon:yes gene_type:complete